MSSLLKIKQMDTVHSCFDFLETTGKKLLGIAAIQPTSPLVILNHTVRLALVIGPSFTQQFYPLLAPVNKDMAIPVQHTSPGVKQTTQYEFMERELLQYFRSPKGVAQFRKFTIIIPHKSPATVYFDIFASENDPHDSARRKRSMSKEGIGMFNSWQIGNNYMYNLQVILPLCSPQTAELWPEGKQRCRNNRKKSNCLS